MSLVSFRVQVHFEYKRTPSTVRHGSENFFLPLTILLLLPVSPNPPDEMYPTATLLERLFYCKNLYSSFLQSLETPIDTLIVVSYLFSYKVLELLPVPNAQDPEHHSDLTHFMGLGPVSTRLL